MKKILPLIAGLFCVASSFASTGITDTVISGHWTTAGSPYVVYNSFTIPFDSTLVIDPGVQVLFQGHYKIDVYGTINAAGTAAAPISFTMQDTTGWYLDPATSSNGGWAGINFQVTFPTPDTSVLDHCNFSYLKNSDFYITGSLHITNCNFSENSGYGAAIIDFYPVDTAAILEVANCTIFNSKFNAGMLISCVYGHSYIHNNSIHDNDLARGDVLVLNQTDAHVYNNDIYNNGQVSDSGTAYIIITDAISGVFTGNKIYKNICYEQGAVYFIDSKIDFNANYVCNNQALLYSSTSTCPDVEGGGAIKIASNDSMHTAINIVRNNIIANNYGAADGGAIFILGANVDIFNNDIVNNSSHGSGGISIAQAPVLGTTRKVRIINNLFLNNVSTTYYTSSPDVYSIQCDTVLFEHNWIQRAFCQDFWTDGLTAGYLIGDTTTNIIGTSPSLVAPTLTASPTESALTADFHLFAPSFCINQGDNSIIGAGDMDYAGNARIWNGTVDIGAYEYGSHPLSVAPVKSAMQQQIVVYPNPATSSITINTPEARGTITIMDISGKILLTKEVCNTTTLVDISTISRGLYFVSWKNNGTTVATKKLIVE